MPRRVAFSEEQNGCKNEDGVRFCGCKTTLLSISNSGGHRLALPSDPAVLQKVTAPVVQAEGGELLEGTSL